jgi:hypothetical protein
MADGAWHQIDGSVAGPPRLGQATAARRSLWAVCGCGREAALNPGPWLGQGLARHPLHELEDRLRCRCGARRARLEIRGLAEAPRGAAGGIYVFR